MLSAARLTGLCHNHQQFLANGSRQVDITHLDAPAPPCYIVGKQCEQYVAEFLYLFIGIVIGTAPTETVESLWCTGSFRVKSEVVQNNSAAPRSRQSVSSSGVTAPDKTNFATGAISPHMISATSIAP